MTVRPTDRLVRARLAAPSAWRARALLEMAAFLAVLITLNLSLYPLDPAYRTVQPHPYLVGIALVASFYGLVEGLAAALLALAAFAGQLVMQDGATVWTVMADEMVHYNALWFLGTGYVLGVIRRMSLTQLQDALSQLSQTKRSLASLEEQHVVLKTAKEELEQRIIGQTASVHSLYESVKALESLEVEPLHASLLRVVAAFTGATRCSLWLAEEQIARLRLANTYGAPMPDHPTVIAGDQGLIALALSQHRVVTVAETQRGQRPDASGIAAGMPSLLCAPLIVGGRLYGVINVEEIPFQRLTLSTVRILGMLADLAGPALDNALAHQRASAEQPTDPETSLLRYPYAAKRLAEECARSQRYKLPVSVLVLEWSGWRQLFDQPADRRAGAIREICQAMRTHLRSVDLIAHDAQPDGFLIVLPLTDVSGALIVAQRVHEALEAATRAQSAGERWLISVGSPKEQETPQSLQARLRQAVDGAKDRPGKRPIIVAD